MKQRNKLLVAGIVVALVCSFAAEMAKSQTLPKDAQTVVEAVGPSPAGVTLNAWIKPGADAKDKIAMHVNLSAPNAKRICIAYTGFETIGFVRKHGAPRIDQLDRSEHKCSDQVGQAELFKDSVVLQRRDAPESSALLRPDYDDLSQAEQRRRTDYRDGYVVVVATLDGEPTVFKVKSRYFALDAMALKKAVMGQSLAN